MTFPCILCHLDLIVVIHNIDIMDVSLAPSNMSSGYQCVHARVRAKRRPIQKHAWIILIFFFIIAAYYVNFHFQV